MSDVDYQYFDFHAECKHMRWERISLLVDRLKEDLEKLGSGRSSVLSTIANLSCRYFAVVAGDEVKVAQQVGVVRTNCMDNLDRTNVVQATLAKYMLNKQLVEIGVLQPGAGVDDFEALSKEFRECKDHLSLVSCRGLTNIQCGLIMQTLSLPPTLALVL